VDGNGKVVYQNGGYQEAKEFIGVGETAVKAQQKKK
jgi:hypothetical protein